MKEVSRGLIEVLPRTFPWRRKKSTTNLRVLGVAAEIRKAHLPKGILKLCPDVKHYGNFL
jgi:hypothetical protein